MSEEPLTIVPTGATLGATVEGLDLRRPLPPQAFAAVWAALGRHGVLRFPRQKLEPAELKAFAGRFGSLEVNVAVGSFCAAGHPEVMILSNIVEEGRPIGLGDAGQGWHTDMSYSREVAFVNALHAIRVPRRDGRPLGATWFANMHAAYDSLPQELKTRLADATATHDFAKFWDMMRARPGNTRPPLTDEQRRRKPPVSQPIFLTHPLTGRKTLYCNPGYAVRIDGAPAQESDELLAFLFEHQLKPEYLYAHRWKEGDVLLWDDLGTLHNAEADYGPDEPRLILRCQAMADRVLDPAFVRGALAEM
jgi:taurine dioxygenase